MGGSSMPGAEGTGLWGSSGEECEGAGRWFRFAGQRYRVALSSSTLVFCGFSRSVILRAGERGEGWVSR